MLRLRIYNHYTLEARLLWDSYCEVSLRMRKICFYFFFFLSNFGVKKTAIILSNDVKFYCAYAKFVFIFSSFFSTSQLVKGLKSKNSRVRSKKNFLSEKNAIMLSNDVKFIAHAQNLFLFFLARYHLTGTNLWQLTFRTLREQRDVDRPLDHMW